PRRGPRRTHDPPGDPPTAAPARPWPGAEEGEVEEEIRLHLELRVEQLSAEGIGPGEARAERCVVLASWTKLVGRCSARRTAGRSGCACAPGWTCCGRTSATARGSSRGTRPLPKIGNCELLIANFEF